VALPQQAHRPIIVAHGHGITRQLAQSPFGMLAQAARRALAGKGNRPGPGGGGRAERC
jgi:hypothetical protein